MKLILLSSLLCAFTLRAQKAQFSFFIPIDSPVKTAMPNMSTNVAGGLAFSYRPTFGFPLMAELKASFGAYGSHTHSDYYQIYEFYDPTNVHFTYSSKMNKYLLGAKWHLGRDFRAIRGFVTPQIGTTGFKATNSYQYTDPNNKQQSDRNLAKWNLNTVYGGEIGFELLLNNLFKQKVKSDLQQRLYFSGSIMRSFKEIKYTNVRNIQSLEHITPESGIVLENPETYVAFTNDYFYEDRITALYRSHLFMWGINVGYIIDIPSSVE